MNKVKIVLLGAGDRGRIYSKYIEKYSNIATIVAVAEPIKERRQFVKDMFNLSDDMVFESWDQVLSLGKIGDVLIVATQDKMHYEPTMKGLDLGYHILLEKPMSPSLKECVEMVEKAESKNLHLIVCHVLRYTSFFRELKRLLRSNAIGELMTVQHIENVGYYHQAHSFVRGHWRNSIESAPMILAKCCHDMDILHWFIESDCDSISSFGSLKYFKSECAPEGSAKRCIECSIKNCPYDARRIYKVNRTEEDLVSGRVWPSRSITEDLTEEGLIKAFKEGPYGRCVYHCDNDVVDSQVINMKFKNGITVAFTMTAFTDKISRITRLMGTHGEIRANTETNEIELYDFRFGSCNKYTVDPGESGHGGGDEGIIKDFLTLIRTGKVDEDYTTGRVSLASHAISLISEEARLTEKVLRVDEVIDSL